MYIRFRVFMFTTFVIPFGVRSRIRARVGIRIGSRISEIVKSAPSGYY